MFEGYKYLSEYAKPMQVPNREMVGREKEVRALQAVLSRPELSNAILLAEAGSGKSIRSDTLVPVTDDRGYVEIGKLKVGDEVFDENGKPTKVLGVYPQGELDAYEVTFSDDAKVVCNDEHIWAARTVWQHYQDDPYSEVTLSEMMDYDIIRESYKPSKGKITRKSMWYVPLAKAVERPEKEFDIDPYVLGVLIGDGCTTCGPAVHISSSDVDLIQHVSNLIGAVDFRKQKSSYSWFFYNDIYVEGKTNTNTVKYSDLTSDLSKYDNVIGCLALNKRIPEEYFLGSIEQRYALLQGLMDTDGTIINSKRAGCSYHTSSKGLAEDFLKLINSLGYKGTITEQDRNDEIHHNIEYSVHISLPVEEKKKLFRLTRKVNLALKAENEYYKNRKFYKHYDDVAIKSVKKLDKKVDMTCIYVDSPNHLYLCTENCIVTHNTSLVQKLMVEDPKKRIYLEVDMARMAAGNIDDMPSKIKGLFDDVMEYRKTENADKEIVLFMDEFHQIVQLSDAAVEALKPALADSGVRKIKVIAATTFVEFEKYVAPNLPLVERLYRLNLREPDKETVIKILKGAANTYDVGDTLYNDVLFEQIYEYTQRYIPMSAQPRKSLLMLDAMIGYHRAFGSDLNQKLLADVISESQGVNVSLKVDAAKIKEDLDAKVYSQGLATEMVARRLNVAVADLHDKTRPMSSFLFTGSTGVGKTELVKCLANILFEDSRSLIRFDMTEYSDPESMERFRTELTNRVFERPFCIVLLDEIEKACSEITRLLLQVLDDGRLMDANNREVSFKNSYVVMTTNAGNQVYKSIAAYLEEEKQTAKVKTNSKGEVIRESSNTNQFSRYRKLIRSALIGGEDAGGAKFPPELYNRIDEVIPFAPLDTKTLEKIIKKKLQDIKKEVWAKHGVKVQFDKNIIPYLLYEDSDVSTDAGGARGIVRKINTDILSEIARNINLNPNNYRVLVIKVEGEMVYGNKAKRVSEAYIEATFVQ